nr:uncharacterized protein LOC111755690 [Cavia porcellus]
MDSDTDFTPKYLLGFSTKGHLRLLIKRCISSNRIFLVISAKFIILLRSLNPQVLPLKRIRTFARRLWVTLSLRLSLGFEECPLRPRSSDCPVLWASSWIVQVEMFLKACGLEGALRRPSLQGQGLTSGGHPRGDFPLASKLKFQDGGEWRRLSTTSPARSAAPSYALLEIKPKTRDHQARALPEQHLLSPLPTRTQITSARGLHKLDTELRHLVWRRRRLCITAVYNNKYNSNWPSRNKGHTLVRNPETFR